MRELPARLNGPRLFELDRFTDVRGSFVESWRRDRFAAAGITDDWVQDNHSVSAKGVIRGMHFQPGQAKLVRVAVGGAFDVVVDLRRDSTTFGRWESFDLGEDPARVLYVPVGFAHGFCAITERTDVHYKVSTPYDPTAERGLAWNDPDVGIAWPVASPLMSDRDRAQPSLADVVRRGNHL
jgi:dTDP-4-dehydrorhamnose 3,5-epimerase